jgi:hypothetical protein
MAVSLYDGVPLRNVEQEIRLLTLLPGEDSVIDCHLRIAQLTDDVQYEALSYAWGRSRSDHPNIVAQPIPRGHD